MADDDVMEWVPRASGDRVAVNVPDRQTLLAAIEARLQADEGFSVATLNLDHVVKLRNDPVFRRAYARHSHIVADGNPIVWLSRLSGRPVSLAPGSELVAPLAALAARTGVPVALFGSTEASLERGAKALEEQNPGLRIVARIAPSMGFDPTGPEADRCIEQLAVADARLCFLALGAPRQEVFAAHAQERLPGTGFVSIGAGIDFISGIQTRAPTFMRAIAAEWIWRLGTDPRRLVSRYGRCIAIMPSLTWTAIRSRRATSGRRSEA